MAHRRAISLQPKRKTHEAEQLEAVVLPLGHVVLPQPIDLRADEPVVERGRGEAIPGEALQRPLEVIGHRRIEALLAAPEHRRRQAIALALLEEVLLAQALELPGRRQ